MKYNQHKFKDSEIKEQSEHNKGKKTLVLDLDETLIHSQLKKPNCDHNYYDFQIKVKEQAIYVTERPFARQFVKFLSKHYEIFIFTASVREYAEKIIESLAIRDEVEYILSREHCSYDYKQNKYIKNIYTLNRNVDKVIIVDDQIVVQKINEWYVINVTQFLGDKNDNVLRELFFFLIWTQFRIRMRFNQQFYQFKKQVFSMALL